MPRPTRIQYPHAFYHVMNRGRGRQNIFHGAAYYQAFLKTLEESYRRFDAVIHAYYLMPNHYHLLIETPRANLERIMRHVNGVYTQRYNRLNRTDGPLFRGRYQAIVVHDEAYLLQVSRYIHRNPVEVKGASSQVLESYRWSSYLAYINRAKADRWLERDATYQMLGHRHQYTAYKAYVEQGIDNELRAMYGKEYLPSVLGDHVFKTTLAKKQAKLHVSGDLRKALSNRPVVREILQAVANRLHVTVASLTRRQSGRPSSNFPRKFAMYCCQQLGAVPLKEIARVFGLTHEGSVSPSVQAMKSRLEAGDFRSEFNKVRKDLGIMK
jgi:REP element-mobilizing transposase RayT